MTSLKFNVSRCFLGIGLLAVGIVGCSSKSNEVEVKGKLKVQYYNQEIFEEEFGKQIMAQFPDIEFEVIPINGIDREEEIHRLVEEQKPDLIFSRVYDEYLQYAEKGMLTELEPWIHKDQYNLDNMVAGVLSVLKKNSEQKLYGLSPTYSNQVLYYNKDLFDQYGVDYPQNQMTWENVFLLANRLVDKEKGIYGYAVLESSFSLMDTVSNTYGLSWISPNEDKKLLSQSDWPRLFELVSQAYRSGAVHYLGNGKISIGPDDRDLFVEGKAAMTVGSESLLRKLAQSDYKFTFGMVTIPVDPKSPNTTFAFRPSAIFGIHSQSDMKQEAWEILKYLNSEEWAKARSKSNSVLLTRKVSMDIYGHSIEPFGMLDYDSRSYTLYDLPSEFVRQLNLHVQNEMDLLIQGKQTPDGAVASTKDLEALLR